MVVAMASLAVAGASIAVFASQPGLRASLMTALVKWTGYNTPGGLWRLAAIFLALVNLKNLPLVWHLRFFRAFFYQLYLQPVPIPPHALFQPTITSTRTTVLETDYNMHKSNSTYFSDMDVSRTHLFTAIMRNAIRKNGRSKKGAATNAIGATEGTKGNHIIALGGISCLFKKEILPYRKYEMWTRILSWNQKWFFLITHMVKPGISKPSNYTLQPWRNNKKRSVVEEEEDIDVEKLKGAIYATAIAKYVIKRGRITVPPEQALIHSEMVPPKPEGWVYKGDKKTLVANGHTTTTTDEEDILEVLPRAVTSDEWNWDVIEAERLRGLKVAQKFADMDVMHEYFDGGKDGVLGEFADLLF